MPSSLSCEGLDRPSNNQRKRSKGCCRTSSSSLWPPLLGGEERIPVAPRRRGRTKPPRRLRASGVTCYPGRSVPGGSRLPGSERRLLRGSTTEGTIFRSNVAREGEEAEVFLEPESDWRDTAVGVKVDEGGRLFIAAGIRAGSSSTIRRWMPDPDARHPGDHRRVQRPFPGGQK